MKNKLIKKLNIILDTVTEENYEAERKKYIAKYTVYEPGYTTGFFGWKEGQDVLRPDVGEAKWNEKYPNGFKSWKLTNDSQLTSYGQQLVLNKIDELVTEVNKLKKK